MKPLILIRFKCTVAGLAALLILATTGGTAVLHVPSNYPTIQAAINATASGDEIKIAPGVYTEQLVISNKSLLTLSGLPGTILRAAPGMQLSLSAFGSIRVPLVGIGLSEDVVVSGLTLEGERLGASQPGPFEGIYFTSSSGRVEDCRIMGFRGSTLDSAEADGVLVVNSLGHDTGVVHVEVHRSTFADNASSITLVGDLPSGPSTTIDPTVLRTSFVVNDNIIVGNGPDPTGQQWGVQIHAGAGGELKRNIITDHDYIGSTPVTWSHGVLAIDEFDIQVGNPLAALQPLHLEGNIFRHNQNSLALLQGDDCTILNNSFEGRAMGYRPSGLALSGKNGLVATNRFSDLQLGILLFGNDADFGTRLGIASNATLIANAFCNVDTNITVEPLATFSEQGTLMTCLQPFLSIRAIQLSWPYWFNGYSVETSPGANGPWTPSDAAPFPQDGQNNLLMPMDSDQQFYRLSRP